MGEVARKQMLKTLATFGQYILPIAFSLGAIVSFTQQKKRSQTESDTKSHQNRSSKSKNSKHTKIDTIPAHESPSTPNHDTWTHGLITALEWKRFEDLCAGYFSAKGYTTKTTELGADGGIDIFLFKPGADKPLGIVQCKAWNTQNVGVKPIRELFGVMTAEQIQLGVFTATGDYTDEARAFANNKHIKLLTGNDLLKLIKELPEEKQSALLSEITKGDYTTPTCPSCGIKMTLRTSQKGNNIGKQFWGCNNYPRCNQKLSVRKLTPRK